MGYLALYRKYRPHNFSDLVGQVQISNIIKNEILNDRISHAYLFSGPRGTGKTSTAKIIAKMINCNNLSKDGIPCGKCNSCINFESSSDIVEIDAASNNGVDEIRELRDKVNLVPTFGRYKVYIIDEVHMLTTQAFNALLKTLEEPPSHIVFILATTEFYKIPITVVSRCQKFQFIKFSTEDIIDRLRFIASNESIKVNDDVLYEIARLSDGGMRDAINMLDQLSSFNDCELSVSDVYKLNGVVSYNDFSILLEHFIKKDISFIIDFVDNLDRNGQNFERFLGDFISFLKDLLIFKNTEDVKIGISDNELVLKKVSCLFNDECIYQMVISFNDLIVRLKSSSFSKILLITEFIKFVNELDDVNISNSGINNVIESSSNTHLINSSKSFNILDKDAIDNSLITSKKSVKLSENDRKIRINNSFATASKDAKEKFMAIWYSMLENSSDDVDFISVVGLLNDVDVMVVGSNYVIFVAKYDSLLERLFDSIAKIEQVLFEVYNIKYKVVFLAKDEWNYEREKFISALKSGKKYQFIMDSFSDDFSQSQINDDILVDDEVKKITSILGNDVISYE